jgi:hypothetical protein
METKRILHLEEYTCKDLNILASEMSDLRITLLCGIVDEAGMAPMAEVEYMKAMAFLEQAVLCLRQAHYFQIRG